jgi:hypothetical protein
MPGVGFEPTILVFQRAMTVYALDRVATEISAQLNYISLIIRTETCFEKKK